MTDNDNWYEEKIYEIFDPNDISEWLKYSPAEFLGIMLLELRQQNVMIRNWAELMAKNPQFSSQVFQFGNQEIAATFFTDVNLRASHITERLLDTIRAYKEEMSKAENKPNM